MYTRKLKDQKKKLKRRKKSERPADPEENIVFSKKTLKITRIFNEDYEDGEYDDILKKYGY